MRCLMKCYGDDHGYRPDRREIYCVTAHSFAVAPRSSAVRDKSRMQWNRTMKLYDCTTAPSPRRVRIFIAEKGTAVPTIQVAQSRTPPPITIERVKTMALLSIRTK